jgi:putative component of toxin-antitoxin plasmid stabilization module
MKVIYTTEQFDDWLSNLRDQQAKRRVQAHRPR